jgi:predicted extracellular nuclease
MAFTRPNRVPSRFARLVLAVLLSAGALSAAAASPNVVISQVYGGGGNSGATWKNDFIELFNRGSLAVSLNGWSVQYASTTGTSWSRTNLTNVMLQPGQYYLIQEAAGAGGTTSLPAPDATGTTAMAAGAGKVALVSNATTIASGTSCPSGASIVDFVGYGTGTNCFEGSGPTATISNTTATLRGNGGCTETDANSSDFATGVPNPRNTASTFHFCSTTSPSGAGAASPGSGPVGTSTLLSVTVTPGTGPVSTGLAVGANLTAIGGAAAQTFYDDGATGGDVTAGDNVFSFTATVAAGTTAGAKSLPFTITDAQARTGSGSISFTVDPPLLAIHTIQGSTSASPYAGQLVATTGIVTAIKLFGGRGFFLEAPDAEWDADPATSEGVFVFTSSVPTVSVGDGVKVTGNVQEFRSATDTIALRTTEITSPSIATLSTGNVLPSAITLTSLDLDPAGAPDQIERYEGMRVHVDELVVTAPTQGSISEPNATSTSTGIFYGVLPGTPRPFREPGIDATQDPLPASPCCYPVFDTNPEKIRVDSKDQPGAVAIDVATGAVVSNLTGPLDYGQDTYSILLDPSSGASVDHGSEMTIVSAPAAFPSEFTVGSANLERFFDTVDDAEQDAVLTPSAFANRLQKASLMIRNVLNLPDILGVEEVEHLSTLQALATKLNDDEVAAGHASPGYAAYLEEGNDIGGIDSGFLVKSSRVGVVDVVQYNKAETYIDPTSGNPALLNDRPPLVLRGTVHHVSGATFPVTVIVNHMRSFSSVSDPTDGPRVRAKRAAQAESLAKLIQSFQTADPNAAIVSVGDYNAYQFSDGYVDSLATIEGHPAAAPDVVLPTGDFVDPDLTNLTDGEPAADRYSYTFSGNAQEIDHVVVNGVMLSRFSHMGHPRVDADFPEINRNDASSPSRISDHDPVVAYFTFPITTNVTATPSTQQYSDLVTLAAAVSPDEVSGVTTATGVDFYVGSELVGSAPLVSDGLGTLVATLANVPLLEPSPFGTAPTGQMAPGARTVTAVFTGAGAGLTVPDATTTLTITPEDAGATYTGSLFTATSCVTCSTATITLSATVVDAADGNRGDIENATVTFVDRDTSTAVSPALPVGLVSAGDTTTGVVTYNWNVDIGSSSSSTFTVGVVVGNYYTRDASADDTVVTVSKPLASEFITGGGTLTLVSSAGLKAGTSGTTTNFGFNVKYNKKGTNLQGTMNVLVRRLEADAIVHVYQIKGTALTSLSVQSAQGKASFASKASIQDITDPLAPVPVDGNATLQVTMTDKGDPGSSDTIGIAVYNKSGGLWFASAWNGTKTTEQTLSGGNLVVR